MIFTTGFGYLLFVTQSNQTISQANAVRQNSLLQAGNEILLPKVTLSGSTLVVSINNTGGFSATISTIYVVDSTGKLVSGFMGPAGTNIPASQWPISLLVGQSTVSLGNNIQLTGYTYTAGTSVMVEIITAKGNTFSSPYPIPATVTPAGNVLVVRMVVTPPQTLTCTNCVTDTVTIYNYASSQITGVSLSPSPPLAQATGTAKLTGGSCGAPAPSSTIPAYPGSGVAPSITITCTSSASTGSVGGVGTFSTSAIGTLNGKGVSSAEAMSNSIQIGGSSNVPTQGAFAANYFFLKFSACQNGPSGSVGSYTYSSPCSTSPATMPPSSLNALTNGNYISGFSDYYVAYYVQVTNNFNATLPILQYTYLFMDPGISTEAYSFLVGANNSAFRTNGAYYPNYNPGGTGIPTLTAYPADCNVVNAKNVPVDTSCLYVNPGQTVTLTFAACGFSAPGTSNWVWGGTSYGQQLDSNSGCITTAPGYQNAIPEGQTFAVVVSYPYRNLVYSQTMPFEGQTVTNLRTDSTTLTCSPNPDAVNAPSTCTVTVTDLSFGTPVTPTGTVTITQTPLSAGTLSNGGTCTLSGGGATATCTVTYTPSLGQEGIIGLTASYPGDVIHSPSTGQTTMTATQRSTTTGVVCAPSLTTPNTPTNCVITVTDTSAGTTVTPTGTIALTTSPASSGTFTPAANCVLSQTSPGVASCSVTYTPNLNLLGTVSITGSYLGDTDHASSSNSAPVKWGRTTSTAVSCVPNPVAIGAATTCTATVTDTYSGSPITPTGTVSFTQGAPGTGTFGSGGTCTLSAGSCSVTFTPGLGEAGSLSITATYAADANHLGSSGSSSITVSKATPTTTVTCTSTTCTATVVGQSPTGTIAWSKVSGAGAVSFGSGGSCTLAAGSCSVTVSGTTAGTLVIQAAYSGDANNLAGTPGTASLTIHTDTIAVSCIPNPFNVAFNSVCTAQLSTFTAPVTGETVTFSQSGGTGSVTFVSTTCTLSAAGSCQVTITGSTAGTATIKASYPGDTANVLSTNTQTVTVNPKLAVAMPHKTNLCTGSGLGGSCSGSVTVTSGDVIVLAISTERTQTTCAVISSISGSRDSGYTVVNSATASFSQGGNNDCVYSIIYYATATSSGSDSITVNFNHNPSSGAVFVYDLSNALLPATSHVGSCNSGPCSTSVLTSPSLAVFANSFLVTTGATCTDSNGNGLTFSTKPAGFTNDYGTGHIEYVGHLLPGSSGSQNFQMTDSNNAACWSIVGAQFVDPPPPPGWTPGTPAQAVAVDASSQLQPPTMVSTVSAISAIVCLVLAFAYYAVLGTTRSSKRREAHGRS
jgi:hypothetical protein